MPRMMRAGLAAVAGMALFAVGVPAAQARARADAAGGVPAAYAGQTLHWGTCPFTPEQGAAKGQCALVTVPRDWAHPDAGVNLKVSISEVPATGKASEQQGVVLTNPGGPGGQGTPLAGEIAGLEPRLNTHYAIIGMDPRGTGVAGSSDPAQAGYQCDVPKTRLPTGPLDARDRSRSSIAEHLKTPRAIAEACQDKAIEPYITTWQTTHDMDLIRQLVGRPKLNYLGYSYGTWLGAKYASMFPAHTGRVVLDSSVNWQGRLLADFADFPRIDQRQFDRVYLPWAIRQYPKVLGPTVSDAKRVYEHDRTYYAGQGISPDDFDQVFVGNGSELQWMLSLVVLVGGASGSDQQLHKTLAAAPARLRSSLEAVSKDKFGVPTAELTRHRIVTTGLGQNTASDYQAVAGTRYSVACDDQPTPSTGYYTRLSDLQGPREPLFGWAYGLGEVCGPWTDAPRHRLPDMPAAVQRHVLVVQGEFDPQTAYEQAMTAAAHAPGASVLRVNDAPFHGQYALRGNPCVDGVINTYLLDGAKTHASLCPSIPLPGESKVYPIQGGPIRQRAKSAGTEQAPGNPDLRRYLDQRIATVNAPRP